VLEALDDFLPMADQQVSREVLKQFKSQGLDIRLSSKVTACRKIKTAVTLAYKNTLGQHKLQVDRILVAVGRRPNTQDLIDEAIELKQDERGFINIDRKK